MFAYLDHHRAFCEHLWSLHGLDVSWDGQGASPLRRRPLQAAMEFFGRRPDLVIGSSVRLKKGGLEIGLFRDGRDIQVMVCKDGTMLVSGHRPLQCADFMISEKTVTEAFLREVRKVLPLGGCTPTLSMRTDTDVLFQDPFEGFEALRLEGAGGPNPRLLVGRSSFLSNFHAYHDVSDLPEDIYRDQQLTDKSRLRDLVDAYIEERSALTSPC